MLTLLVACALFAVVVWLVGSVVPYPPGAALLRTILLLAAGVAFIAWLLWFARVHGALPRFH